MIVFHKFFFLEISLAVLDFYSGDSPYPLALTRPSEGRGFSLESNSR